jgi:hypothetical protein
LRLTVAEWVDGAKPSYHQAVMIRVGEPRGLGALSSEARLRFETEQQERKYDVGHETVQRALGPLSEGSAVIA